MLRMKFLFLVVLGMCLLGVGPAMAADAGVVVDAAVVVADAGVATAADLIDQAGKGFTEARGAISDPNLATIMLAVSSGLYFLISLMRRFGASWLSGNTVRVATIIGGAVAALATNLAVDGVSVWQTLIIFLSGPGSIAINETLQVFKPKSEEPSEEPPASSDDAPTEADA